MGFPCWENMGAVTLLRSSDCQMGIHSLAALPVSPETNALSCWVNHSAEEPHPMSISLRPFDITQHILGGKREPSMGLTHHRSIGPSGIANPTAVSQGFSNPLASLVLKHPVLSCCCSLPALSNGWCTCSLQCISRAMCPSSGKSCPLEETNTLKGWNS